MELLGASPDASLMILNAWDATGEGPNKLKLRTGACGDRDGKTGVDGCDHTASESTDRSVKISLGEPPDLVEGVPSHLISQSRIG